MNKNQIRDSRIAEAGFHKDRGTMDQILNLRILLHTKAREHQKFSQYLGVFSRRPLNLSYVSFYG